MFVVLLHHRRRIIREKMLSEVESYMLEDHQMLRRAATEMLCNMCMCEEVRFDSA